MVAVPTGLSPHSTRVQVAATPGSASGLLAGSLNLWQERSSGSEIGLHTLAALLVVLPVFVQAPWVRQAPMAAALFTAVLVTAGVLLERQPERRLSELGALLVGFSGSWLAGCLFWGWCRLHPLWHLPIEAFALPLAVAGLRGRWRLAGAFYLASLLGTAATDAAMAVSGVMQLWPQVLSAPLQEAPQLLQDAALAVLRPMPLLVVAVSAGLLLALCSRLRQRGPLGQLASVTLGTTLAIDGLFLVASLAAPGLTGLI